MDFKKILLPIDFSVYCDRAAEYAAWLAQASGGTVHLLHVIVNPADALYEPDEVVHWVLVAHAEKRSRDMMAEVARRCLPLGTPVEFHVRLGDPHRKIHELCDTVHPDVIVMSTHGRGGIKHLVMGSVAEKTLRHARCPVFAVPRLE